MTSSHRVAVRRVISFSFSVLLLFCVISFLIFRIVYYREVTAFTFSDVIVLGGSAGCALLALFLKNYWLYLGGVVLLIFYGLKLFLLCIFFANLSKHQYGSNYEKTDFEEVIVNGFKGFGVGVGIFGIACCVAPGITIYLYNFLYDREAQAFEINNYDKLKPSKENEENTYATTTLRNYTIYQYQQDKQEAAKTHPLSPGIV